MTIDLQIVPHQTYLHVTLTGQLDLQAAQAAIAEIVDAAWEHRLSRILIDWRHVAGVQTATTLERFEGTRFLADQVAQLRARGLYQTRIAHIVLEVRDNAEGFSETVAANRGVETAVTTSVAEALAWLGGEAADSLPRDADDP